eukprot:TRINITY_DN91_c0_g1_i1.p2 TRINITY_DN91_c0_g1~~TRINITY_DN91_c0_g1_i1.p2  ORF type:complete len:294 (+),score=126.27 TRINITY_DN91_c0_g1_i1:69-884(+)
MATESTPLTHKRLSRRASSRRGEISFVDDHIDMDGSFKAGVFGFNDGLCANTCLMIGIGSASGITPGSVIAAGLVGLIAGAASMGAGEWISGTLENSYEKHEIERERDHLRHYEEIEDRNLSRTLREEFGFSQETINHVFKDMQTGDTEKDFDMKLRLNVKLEMGLDVDGERSNPIKAMTFMMGAFSLGAIIPLIPWLPFWYPGPLMAMWLSVVCALLATLIVGMRLAQETGEPIFSTALRQVWAATIAIVSVWGVGYVFQLLTGNAPPAA